LDTGNVKSLKWLYLHFKMAFFKKEKSLGKVISVLQLIRGGSLYNKMQGLGERVTESLIKRQDTLSSNMSLLK